MTLTVRIGGVPEHFNLPWRLAIEEGAFHALGIDAVWVDFPGGTGAIMKALAAAEIDIATPLTEGAVTAIANGNPSRLLRVWVDSPLLWGVHVASASDAQTIDDVQGQRFAISRHGSGSELISRVMADQRGWELTADHFVVVGGLDGALTALPAGDAEIFLWNKSMTQPHVDNGTFRRVGIMPPPWPSFVTAASGQFLDHHAELAHVIARTAALRAHALATDPEATGLVMERYDLAEDDVRAWQDQVVWTLADDDLSRESAANMLADVASQMHRLGRIDETPAVADLIA